MSPSKSVSGVVSVLEILREIDKGVTITEALAYLYVANNPGCNQASLRENLKAYPADVSRMVFALSPQKSVTKRGMDLIVQQNNLEDRRERSLFLTPKGQAVYQKILAALG